MKSQEVAVLVIEDLSLAQQVAYTIFKRLNCHVTVMPNATRALSRLLSHHFDIIFIDLNLPDMEGFELAQTIRGMERKTHRPIIALTANSSADLDKRCQASGIDDFLIKPLSVESARYMLKKHLFSKFGLDDVSSF